jgi:isocitrate dehydrogenase kinase/phosphatase
VILTKSSLKRDNFSPDEFFASQEAIKLKINNYPPKEQEQEVLTNLNNTADRLQEVYNILKEEYHRRLNYGKKFICKDWYYFSGCCSVALLLPSITEKNKSRP